MVLDDTPLWQEGFFELAVEMFDYALKVEVELSVEEGVKLVFWISAVIL
jgi:hypothetical protein